MNIETVIQILENKIETRKNELNNAIQALKHLQQKGGNK